MIVRLAADPSQDVLQTLALTASAALYDELSADLLRRLSAGYRHGDGPTSLLQTAQAVLARYQGPMAALLADARLAALLGGAAGVATLLPPSKDPPRLNVLGGAEWGWDGGKLWLPIIEAAVADLQARHLMTRIEWETAADDVRRQAFTTAAVQSQEALGHVRDGLVEAVAQGTGLQAFRAHMRENVETSDVGAGTLENIFRTGTATAYSAGMDRVLESPIVGEAFPFEESLGIPDSRQTELCHVINHSGLDGTAVFLRDDPTYQKFKIPRHFGDRCSRNPLTVEMAAERGVKYAQEWLRLGQRPDRLGWVAPPPVSLPKGWTPGGR